MKRSCLGAGILALLFCKSDAFVGPSSSSSSSSASGVVLSKESVSSASVSARHLTAHTADSTPHPSVSLPNYSTELNSTSGSATQSSRVPTASTILSYNVTSDGDNTHTPTTSSIGSTAESSSTTESTTTATTTTTVSSSTTTAEVSVTQGAFLYNDTSASLAPQIKMLYDQFNNLFEPQFGAAIENSTDPSSFIEKYLENINAKAKNWSAEGFLIPGEATARTSDNCYIIKVRRDAQHKTMSDIHHVLSTIHAKVRLTVEESLKGFIACFEPGELPLVFLKTISWIEFVERDQFVRASQRQENAPWGLARLSEQPKSVFKSTFSFDLTGEGVNVYVIDSGVWESHPEFGNRARIGYSAFGGSIGSDCSGHGTEVASVIAGVNVGVAKKANIIVAQVLDCTGQGQNSDLVYALDWIVRKGKPRSVINMSVGGPISPSLEEAVRVAVNRGFIVVAAAGNAGSDACLMSPSRVPEAIVVGASTEDDKRARFSNFGRCVSMFAPGTNIMAASILSKKKKQSKLAGYDFVSGTSLATPFASGVIALLLQKYPKSTPHEIRKKLLSLAAKGVLDDSTLQGSPNVLLRAPTASSSTRQLVAFFPIVSLPGSKDGPGYAGTFEGKIVICATIVSVLVSLAAVLILVRRCMPFRINK